MGFVRVCGHVSLWVAFRSSVGVVHCASACPHIAHERAEGEVRNGKVHALLYTPYWSSHPYRLQYVFSWLFSKFNHSTRAPDGYTPPARTHS